MLVETGVGLRDADAYVTVAFATSYLTKMGRATEAGWGTQTNAVREAAIIKATQALDLNFEPRLKGSRKSFYSQTTATSSFTFTDEPASGSTITVGDLTLTLVDSTPTSDTQVELGGTPAATAAAVAATLAVKWSLDVVAAGAVVTVPAAAPGSSGNFTALSTSTPLTIVVTPFTGGADAGPQSLAFPRTGLTDQYGLSVTGVPTAVQYSTVEYAVRTVNEALFIDPQIDSSGQMLLFKKEVIGPIEEESRFSQAFVAVRKVSAVERMMMSFLKSSQGGTMR
jgi:hypothetical protein